jgi:hypothetical protein
LPGRLLPGITGAGAVSYAVCRRADANRDHAADPAEHEERAVYVLSGDAQLNGEPVEPQLVVLPEGEAMSLFAESDVPLVLLAARRWMGRGGSTGILSRAIRSDREARATWAAGDWPTVPGEASGSNCLQQSQLPAPNRVGAAAFRSGFAISP